MLQPRVKIVCPRRGWLSVLLAAAGRSDNSFVLAESIYSLIGEPDLERLMVEHAGLMELFFPILLA